MYLKVNPFLLILLPRLVTRCHDGDLHLLSPPAWVQASLPAWHSMTYCRRLGEGVTFQLSQPKVVWFDSAALHFVRTFCVVWAVGDAGVDLQRRQRGLYLQSTPVRENTRAFKGRFSDSSSVSWILTFGSVWVQFQQKKKKRKSLSRTMSSKSGGAIRLCVSFRAPPPLHLGHVLTLISLSWGRRSSITSQKSASFCQS